MKADDKHIVHYMILIIGLCAFAVTTLMFKSNMGIKIFVAFAAFIFYVLWGIIHHVLEHRFSKEILIEYLAFGALAFTAAVVTFSI